MAELRKIGVALLAAGASRRFGDADKLSQRIGDDRLGEIAAIAFPRSRCSRGWVIVSAQGHPCERVWATEGFEPVANPLAHQGMGTSVALAAQLALHECIDALAIVLADMPMVPTEHFVALIDAVADAEDIATSAIGDARMPPAVFGSAHFSILAEQSGDRGARGLLEQGKVVECPAGWLIDIDTPADLAKHGH